MASVNDFILTLPQVARLTNITPERLKYWAKRNLVVPRKYGDANYFRLYSKQQVFTLILVRMIRDGAKLSLTNTKYVLDHINREIEPSKDGSLYFLNNSLLAVKNTDELGIVLSNHFNLLVEQGKPCKCELIKLLDFKDLIDRISVINSHIEASLNTQGSSSSLIQISKPSKPH